MTVTLDMINLIGAKPATVQHAAIPLMIALDKSYNEDERVYNIGRVTGMLVAVGLEPSTTLRVAEAVYFATKNTYADIVKTFALTHKFTHGAQRAAILESSGVLYGYAEFTADRDDAEDCFVCGNRICTDLDDYGHCECGFYCPAGDCGEPGDHTRECRVAEAEDWAADAAIDYALGK